MKRNKLYNSITNVRDEYLEEAQILKSKKKTPMWIKLIAMAACLCLFVIGGVTVLLRLDYMKAGCSASPGAIVDDVYYFYVRHKGVYSYTPDNGKQKILHTWQMEEWQVNDYGLYYCKGKSLYVRPHETEKKKKLFTARDSSHIRFELQPDGNVMITTYNKHTELISEILIDGKSGEVIARVMPPTSYKQYYKSGKYSDFHYSIGSRQLELTYVGEDTTYALFENGKNILPDDLLVYRDSGIYFGNTLILSGYRKDLDDTNNEILVVLRPDGKDTILTIPNRNYYTGTDEYIFYSQNNDIWCLALAYGTTWELEQYTDTAVDFYSISANSNYLYSCAPWKAGHECWRIEYDTSGKPAGITLIDDNILE